MRTKDYGIPLIPAGGQAQSEIIHNEAIRMLQALIQPAIDMRDDPPEDPEEGDVYIAGAAATGEWEPWPNKPVFFGGDAWGAVPDVDDDGVDIPMGPRHYGLRKFVQYMGGFMIWDGAAWIPD